MTLILPSDMQSSDKEVIIHFECKHSRESVSKYPADEVTTMQHLWKDSVALCHQCNCARVVTHITEKQ